ncbi:MAG TPA: hypothetical protein VHV08_15205 [Pirellulales bacterium]|nr:hypothetical protein [Pirellulales bacterium]
MNFRSTTNRSGKTLLVYLVPTVIVLAIATFWMWQRQPAQPNVDEAHQATDRFLELVRQGHADQAWQSTTAEFKSAQGREVFVGYVKSHSWLKEPLSFVSVQTVTLQDRPRAECVYRSPKSPGTVRLLIDNDHGVWRVDRIALPET